MDPEVPFWIYIVGVGIAFSRGFIDGSAMIEMVHISFLVRALLWGRILANGMA
jgi:hypothetical protein